MKIVSKQLLLAASAALALAAAGGAQAAQLLTDGSFETPNIGTGNYTYPGLPFGNIAPIGAVQGGWTFNGAALVNASGGNAWYSGAGPAGKDGAQFVSLQGTSSITQDFTADASTLHLGWLSAGRTAFGCCNGDQSYNITLNGSAVGGAFSTVSNSDFSANTLNLTGLTVGSTYTLGFKGLVAADESAFIDNVVLSDTALPPPPPVPTITRLSNLTHTDPGIPFDEHSVVNFDDPNAPGYTFNGGFVRSGALGLWPGVSAPPPGDLSNYETVMGGQTATFTAPHLLRDFSFYLGSPDSYNSVEFQGPGFDWLLHGDAIWGGTPPGNGDQSLGLRIRYDFTGAPVNKVIFSSSGNSFEFDTLAAGGVPEPATWGLMILGFGALGAMARRRRAIAAAA
jgi:hypothetical protein